uniref:Uncharacterized protein n=1 Tax=Leptocylindrus danicus TaxID=163516 RepID=A0A7S2NVE5_9STRA|mmetsp:Transcript_1385/g.2010  ORF Transcript_1385/g.2010 Transcript_1385/m.2010 type:complete len:142 (+) Transcript_1385:205-630(+)
MLKAAFWDSDFVSDARISAGTTRWNSAEQHENLEMTDCLSALSSSSSSRDVVKHEHVGLEQKHVITAARRKDFFIKVPNYCGNVSCESCCELHFFAVQSSYCSRLYRGELGVIPSVRHQLDGASATILGTYIIAHYVIPQE